MNVKAYLLIIIVLLLQACSEAKTSKPLSATQPVVVQLSKVKLTNTVTNYEFPARVSAVKSVDLKFQVSGRLIFENLTQGSMVTKGQVLAQIDAKPFKRQVAESKIRLQDAERKMKRIKDLFAKKLVSQREYDDAKSQLSIRKIALENAKQNLSYCTIAAPFDAVIGARYIENNSFVRSGDILANLQDRSALYFSLAVPERIMTANAGQRDFKATAHIIGQEHNVFALHYVEHKTTPDAITQTYEVTFALDGKATNIFYPGSRAIVNIIKHNQQARSLLIPVNALMGNAEHGFSVWLYQEESQTITARKVVLKHIENNFAVIASGVNADDKVVSAGVSQLREGITVKAYQTAL